MSMNPRLLKPTANDSPASIPGLALWLDASQPDALYTTDAGPVVPVNDPRDISGCVLWLDGADSSASGMTLNGSLVETWKDKSGQGNNATASGSLRPTLIQQGLGGKSLLRFDGGMGLFGPLSPTVTTDQYSVFVVCKISGSVTNQRVFSIAANSSSDFSTGMVIPCLANTASSSQLSTFSPPSSNVGVVAGFSSHAIFSGVATTSAVTNASNGAKSETASIALTVDAQRFGVGAPAQGGAGGFIGDIAEVIFYGTALSNTDRARVEAYLAAKWGISGVHASVDREASPVSSPTELAGCVGWYDASDAASLFDSQSGGSTVSTNGATIARWEDKSGNGRHLTQSTANTGLPTLSTNQLAGRNVVAFGGTGTGSGFSMTNPVSRDTHTVLVVYRSEAQSDASGSLINDSGAGFGMIISRGASTVLDISSGNSTVGSGRFQATLASSPTAVVGPAITSWLHASPPVAFQNGSVVSSATTSGAVTLSRVGYYNVNATIFRLKGYIAELVIFDSALSPIDRARVEKYLANKWGIANVPDPTPPVGYWRDRSGNGRHATQSTAARRPVVGSQNGRTTLTFDGSDDHLLLGNLSSAFPTAAEIIAAFGIASTDTGYVIYQTGDNITSDVFGSSTFSGAFRGTRLNGASLPGLPTGAGSYLWGVSSSSSSHNLFLQGAGVLSSAADYAAGANHAIGGRTDGISAAVALGGRINEVCVFSRVLTANERQRVNRYLARKWGITLAPLVSNADAQDWVNRVYANGGTVSQSTANKVSTFCDAIDAANIRDKFYRLNLFCGTGLNACLVPLYRGPTLTGATFGNVTDTNVSNAFGPGDYVETGATGGLLGNSTTKHLNTGFRTQDLPGVNDCHIAVWSREATVEVTRAALGAIGNTSDVYIIQRRHTAAGGNQFRLGGASNFGAGGEDFSAQSMIASRTSATSAIAYKNGSAIATQATLLSGATLSSQVFGVFTALQSGTTLNGNFPHRLCGYSIGAGLLPEDVTAFHNAWNTFQNAMGRGRASDDAAFASVNNPDAKLWIDTVYGNGGEVSTTTANAVNTFCNSIDAANLRGKFYRLNLFCGSNLNACLVPLYRGQSPGGAQYGNTTDASQNFFNVDYVETGAGGGLTGNGLNKTLNTGFQAFSAGLERDNVHLSTYLPAAGSTSVGGMAAIHAMNTASTRMLAIAPSWFGGNLNAWSGAGGVLWDASHATARTGHFIFSRTGGSSIASYRQGAAMSGTANMANDIAWTAGDNPATAWIFSRLGASFFYAGPQAGYSIGLGLDATQAAAFANAMQAFQSAMGRNV